MKKVMILGAGVYQAPLIKKASQLGLYTVVVSIPGNYPGFAYADRVLYIDTTDTAGVLRAAREEKIDAICLTGTDVAVKTLGAVCDDLHLCGISLRSALLASDKGRMKQAFAENGVRTARFCCACITAKTEELAKICEQIGYPVIFKAVDSSGSRGISRVCCAADIPKALSAVRTVTKKNTFLIEEFLTGEEFGAQAFVKNGQLQFVLPHGDIVFQGAAGVPFGHYVPYGISHAAVVWELEKAVKALHLDDCAVNADFMLCPDGIYVLEIGARCGATCLAEMVSIYYGSDYYEKILRSALGEAVDFTPVNDRRVANISSLIASDKTGVITEIGDRNPPNANIAEIVLDYGRGESVREFQVGPDRIGHVIAKGENLEEARRALQEALNNIHITICG